MDTIERSWMFITSGSYRVGVMLVHLSLIYSPETETPEIKKRQTNKTTNEQTKTKTLRDLRVKKQSLQL